MGALVEQMEEVQLKSREMEQQKPGGPKVLGLSSVGNQSHRSLRFTKNSSDSLKKEEGGNGGRILQR